MLSFCAKFLLFFFFAVVSAGALSPEERLANPVMEEKARQMFLEVRCVVCGGQVIESSDSAFSFEMRQLIRQKFSEGKNEAQIKRELVEEFGSDILINPDSKQRGGRYLFAITFALMFSLSIIFLKIFLRKK